MIRSMTGYGKGEFTLYDRKITVEIKSVNHRYNDITVKLPRMLNQFEDRVKKQLSVEIFRGKTDVYINMDTFSKDDVKITLNVAFADAYMDELIKMKERYKLDDMPDIATITKMPDIFTVSKDIDEEKSTGQIREALDGAVTYALERFIKMRETEGSALKNDVLLKLAHIIELMENIKIQAPMVVPEHIKKLQARLESYIGSEIDENRIMTEITIIADRLGIDEELIRMDSHISQLDDIVKTGGAVGRKLDFIVQEMNREINTIGSKTNDLLITKNVVEVKAEIEKIREQIQNIE